ncbi:MAG: 4a-hydroxytetrahydrobiopterin dehydratase [Cyanobium sp.]
MGLAEETCIPCLDGGPTLGKAEIVALLAELRGWQVVDGHHLQRAWSFPDFARALAWLERAAAICEQQGHHADFQLGWGRVEARIHTHRAGGLTRADFVLAARFDAAEAAGLSGPAEGPYAAYARPRE